jgi:hypothetical protein
LRPQSYPDQAGRRMDRPKCEHWPDFKSKALVLLSLVLRNFDDF